MTDPSEVFQMLGAGLVIGFVMGMAVLANILARMGKL